MIELEDIRDDAGNFICVPFEKTDKDIEDSFCAEVCGILDEAMTQINMLRDSRDFCTITDDAALQMIDEVIKGEFKDRLCFG